MQNLEAGVLTSDFVSHTRDMRAVFKLDTYLLRWQYEGSCSAIIQGRHVAVEPGSLLWFAPGESYELILEPRPGKGGKPVPVSDYYLYCQGSWVARWWEKRKRTNNIHIPMDESILGIWKQIILEKRKREENREITDYLLRVLCLKIDRLMEEGAHEEPASNRSFLVYRMKDYIEKHATEKFQIKDVAAHAGLSTSRSVALFKAMFGKTIMQYTMEMRLSIAMERIRYSKMTLEQISETCGFGSYSYFFRAFRTHYGVSPKVYREKNEGP